MEFHVRAFKGSEGLGGMAEGCAMALFLNVTFKIR